MKRNMLCYKIIQSKIRIYIILIDVNNVEVSGIVTRVIYIFWEKQVGFGGNIEESLQLYLINRFAHWT